MWGSLLVGGRYLWEGTQAPVIASTKLGVWKKTGRTLNRSGISVDWGLDREVPGRGTYLPVLTLRISILALVELNELSAAGRVPLPSRSRRSGRHLLEARGTRPGREGPLPAPSRAAPPASSLGTRALTPAARNICSSIPDPQFE